MPEAAKYSAIELLRDESRVEIRALKPDDRADVLAALDHTSGQSLYRRFFSARRTFTDQEIAFFLDVDFISHAALVAVVKHDDSGEEIVGVGRYIMLQPGRAEAAFTVVDQYQGRGLGTVLLRHLAAIAREAGVHEFIAEVLPDNTPMLEVFEHSGLRMTSRREPGVVHVTLRLA